MTNRTRKNHIKYAQHIKEVKKKPCEFCAFEPNTEQVLKEFSSFWIVRNIFPYDFWDSSNVLDHLMLVPKRHVDSIAHFNADEQKEYMDVLADYEKTGYSIYARAPLNGMKSVAHQHSHLIKLESQMKKFVLFLKKPHILITK